MVKFVAVRDVEAPRDEQDEGALAKHRQFDNTVVARSAVESKALQRGWEHGSVGWGVLGAFGSAQRDERAQVVRSDRRHKLVRNDKGLWVKDDSAVEEERKDGRPRRRSRSPARRRRRSSPSSSDDSPPRFRERRRDDGRDRRRRSRSPPRRDREDESRRRPPRREREESRRPRREEEEKRPPPPDASSPPPSFFAFSASQVVDRVLEVFNSDAPAAERRAAVAACCQDGGLEVAVMTGDRRVTTRGPAAVDALAAASDHKADPRLRVFMEPGGARDDAATLCLDAYAAHETPGLSAVVKGKPAPTLVLYRAHRNHLTHAWLAPERDGFARDWAAVTEDAFLRSKAMTHANAILADHLPPGADYWDLHFHNYAHIPTI